MVNDNGYYFLTNGQLMVGVECLACVYIAVEHGEQCGWQCLNMVNSYLVVNGFNNGK